MPYGFDASPMLRGSLQRHAGTGRHRGSGILFILFPRVALGLASVAPPTLITAEGGGATHAWCALHLLFCYRFLPPDWQATCEWDVREGGFDGKVLRCADTVEGWNNY